MTDANREGTESLTRSLTRLHKRIGVWDWGPTYIGRTRYEHDYRFKPPPSDPKAKPVEYRCGHCRSDNGCDDGHRWYRAWPCPTMRRVQRLVSL